MKGGLSKLLLALTLIMGLSAGGVAPPPKLSSDPSLESAKLAQECDQQGGEIIRNGFGIPLCQTQTADGGNACISNADCEGFCLTESKTCTPTTPYFGCFSVLVEPNQPADLCVD